MAATSPRSGNVTHARLRRSAMLLAVLVGVGMIAGKWAAYLLTNSHAILSDALESIVHLAATVFAYVSIWLSAKPPDPKYPYGYGKIDYFSAGFEGGLIVLAALAILYEATQGLIRGEAPQRLDAGLALIGLASVVNLALGYWLIAQGKKTGSIILQADGQHVLADSVTSFGVILGVGLVWFTGWRVLDPIVAYLVALNILKTGYQLVWKGATGLMDRADAALLETIVSVLSERRLPEWLDVHQLRAWQAGDRTHIDFHLVVPPELTAIQLHDTLHQARAALRAELSEATEVIIHFDPNVPERSYAHVSWTLETATRSPGGELPRIAANDESVLVGDEVIRDPAAPAE